MASRSVPLVLVLVLLGAACTDGRSGPTDAVTTAVDTDDALRAAGARQAARAFVGAYAEAPADDGAALRTLAGTPLLRRWAGWLQVQNAGFPGAVAGEPSGVQIGPAVAFEVESVPGSAELLREVEVRASVTFAFEPSDGDPFTVVRSLDGPMRLLRDPAGDWAVLDFTRDAIPLTSQFEGVRDAAAHDEAARATVAAFFAAPTWQFGIVLRAARALRLAADDVTLVDADGAVVATAGAITTQLARVPSGRTVRGLAAFEARSSAEGLFLRLAFDGGGVLRIPLEGRIHPLAVPEGTGSGTPTPSPGG